MWARIFTFNRKKLDHPNGSKSRAPKAANPPSSTKINPRTEDDPSLADVIAGVETEAITGDKEHTSIIGETLHLHEYGFCMLIDFKCCYAVAPVQASPDLFLSPECLRAYLGHVVSH